MEYDIDNLVDQAYQDREPIEDRGNNEDMERILKIQKELKEELKQSRIEIEKDLLKLVDELKKIRIRK